MSTYIPPPRVHEQQEKLLPSKNIEGNTSANLQHRGQVCSFGNDILLTTSKGIVKFSYDTKIIEVFTEKWGEFLNIVDETLYYMDEDSDIYGMKNNATFKVKDNFWYGSESIQVVFDKIYLWNFHGIHYIGCIDLLSSNRVYSLEGPNVPVDSTYYEEKIYYIDEAYLDYENHYMCELDILTKKVKPLFEKQKPFSTYFIDNSKIYYSYNDGDKDTNYTGIWQYDLNTNENKRILKLDDYVNLGNIIGNKLIYVDRNLVSKACWYLYNIETKEIITIEHDYRFLSAFVANDIVIIYNEKDDMRRYSLYDKNGVYLDIDIPY